MSALAAGKTPASIRLGHAFPNPPADAVDWIQWTYDFLRGKVDLEARAATNTGVVSQAEEWLGISASDRPVYAYVGSLHPALGRIGLVLSSGWLARGLQGGSRCDSGGLVGRFGGFACVGPDLACRAALEALSFNPAHDWETDLRGEVDAAHGAQVREYTRGTMPDPKALDAHRRSFIEHAVTHGVLDKRLWTWEIRALSPAKSTDVFGVAIAHEAYKMLDDLRRTTGDDLAGFRFMIGSPTPAAIDLFDELQVVDALAGLA